MTCVPPLPDGTQDYLLLDVINETEQTTPAYAAQAATVGVA
jgi:hypothetical protein